MTKQAHDYTKFHKFIEGMEKIKKSSDWICQQSKQISDNREFYKLNPYFIREMCEIPIFVNEFVSDDNFPDLEQPFKDIIKAVGLNLPFDKFIIEYDYLDERHFMMIIRRNDDLYFSLFKHGHGISIIEFIDYKMKILDGDFFAPSQDVFMFNPVTTVEYTVFHCTAALSKLIVNLATKGIEQEHIKASETLNKVRKQTKKRPVPDVTVIKIGHYYDRKGNRHEHTKNSPRLHWRRGHMRGVWTGPRDGERELQQRYIFPCLVNYTEGDEKPAHQLRVLQ